MCGDGSAPPNPRPIFRSRARWSTRRFRKLACSCSAQSSIRWRRCIHCRCRGIRHRRTARCGPKGLCAIDGDVLIGPGVALLSTPGHTIGESHARGQHGDGDLGEQRERDRRRMPHAGAQPDSRRAPLHAHVGAGGRAQREHARGHCAAVQLVRAREIDCRRGACRLAFSAIHAVIGADRQCAEPGNVADVHALGDFPRHADAGGVMRTDDRYDGHHERCAARLDALRAHPRDRLFRVGGARALQGRRVARRLDGVLRVAIRADGSGYRRSGDRRVLQLQPAMVGAGDSRCLAVLEPGAGADGADRRCRCRVAPALGRCGRSVPRFARRAIARWQSRAGCMAEVARSTRRRRRSTSPKRRISSSGTRARCFASIDSMATLPRLPLTVWTGSSRSSLRSLRVPGSNPAEMRSFRGWTEEEWAKASRGCGSRGILDAAGGLTADGGAHFVNDVEGMTDRLAADVWEAMDESIARTPLRNPAAACRPARATRTAFVTRIRSECPGPNRSLSGQRSEWGQRRCMRATCVRGFPRAGACPSSR